MLLREKPEKFKELVHKKNPHLNVEQLIDLDRQFRSLSVEVDDLRRKKNEFAKQGKQQITQELIQESKNLSKILKEKEELLVKKEAEFQALYLHIPNIPAPDVPEGGVESNKVVKEWGKKTTFSFPVKNHMELGIHLGWLDFQSAATMTGSQFVVYKEGGVQLLHALITFMLKHNMRRGFKLVYPPSLVNERSLEINGNFPKFKDDVYATSDNLYLIPTSEVALTNLYRDTIFAIEQLPLRLTAATSCFRREAGGYGAKEHGLIRMHQFEKVEIYTYCIPEESDKQLNYMIETAETLLQLLNIPYRILLLAAQDMSFPSSKTYDIEIWSPSQQRYIEISSGSNCTDFQARRGAIRYRLHEGEKTQYVHTLNCSSLALPRLIAVLMETYQQQDGSISIPEILTPYIL